MCLRIRPQDFLKESSRQNEVKEKERQEKMEDSLMLDVINEKGIITINRPVALNAMTVAMTFKMTRAIQDWNDKNFKKFILVKGVGGAFSAGGDVKELVTQAGQVHFRAGYTLDYIIATLKTPYIALMDGISMGGGLALGIHGRYRVATERTLVAMPEVQIGFIPDVGSSYFLPRMLGGNRPFGMFMALTGHRLKGSDVFHTGLATHMCHSSMIGDLEHDLLALDFTNLSTGDIEKVLNKYHDLCPDLTSQQFTLKKYVGKIERIFSAESVEAIVADLEEEAKICPWASNTLKQIKVASPTSLKITFKLQKLGMGRSLLECLGDECFVSEHICKSHDFKEGITARVVEKNRRQPRWDPPTLEQVTESSIQHYFDASPQERLLLQSASKL